MSFPQLSAFAPQTESLGRIYGSGQQWIGWTGTDAAHHLNLQWNFTDPATKTVLNEMALGGQRWRSMRKSSSPGRGRIAPITSISLPLPRPNP
jgi:hypothetical protein